MIRAKAPAVLGEPAAIPRPRVVRERSLRRGRLGAAIALMAVFALAAAALFGYVSRTRPYLAIARDVVVGAQITAADLVTVHLNPAPGLAPVPSSQLRAVVGKYTSVALLSGMLLTENVLVDKPFPAPGEQVVGLALKAGQMPSTPLRPGTSVLLVSTAEDSAVPGAAAGPSQTQSPSPGRSQADNSASGRLAGPVPTIRATVVHVVAGAREGTATVSVAVRDSDGPLVARLAAQGRLVLTLTSGD